MKKHHSAPFPRAGTPGNVRAAANIRIAKDKMQQNMAAGGDLRDSARDLRNAIAEACREDHPEWVTKFATGKVPGSNPLSSNAAYIIDVLIQQVESGSVEADTLTSLDEMMNI